MGSNGSLPPIRRVYHHYERLEEFHAGMWRIVTGDEERDLAARAASLLRDDVALGDAMMGVALGWPISCEHNLTVRQMNRHAWLGQAACCLAVSAPESATRLAWRSLSDDEMVAANDVADTVIAIWESTYTPTGSGSCQSAD